METDEVLALLRQLDSHFQRTEGVDGPANTRVILKKDASGNRTVEKRIYIDSEIYDLWRRVRGAITDMERRRS